MSRVKAAIDNATTPGVTTTLIVVALIAAITFLTWADKVNGDAFVSIASAIIGGVLVRAGVTSGSQATANPPPEG